MTQHQPGCPERSGYTVTRFEVIENEETGILTCRDCGADFDPGPGREDLPLTRRGWNMAGRREAIEEAFAEGDLSVEELEHEAEHFDAVVMDCALCVKELEELGKFDSIEGVRPPLPRTTEEFVSTVRAILS